MGFSKMKTSVTITGAALVLVGCVLAQVDIRDNYNGFQKTMEDPDAGTKEIYTSTHQLLEFFETEKEFVNDIRQIIEKKLVSQRSVGALGGYVASFDDVLGGQEDDIEFLYNPINVYNLIRHVAVGWSLVENTLNQEKQERPGQLPKRVRKVLNRSKKHHIPGAEDLDGVSAGIVRLHDYYRFNLTSFVNEGVIETDEIRSETSGDLTVWDAFKIGVKGANQMLLGSGIDIMLQAFDKAKSDGMVSVPPFVEQLDMKVLKNLIKTAKTVHDQKLDRWGPRTHSHSVNSVPYDKRLAKKKKFHVQKETKVILNDTKIIESGLEKEQFIELCRSIDLRPPSVTKNLYCKYSNRGKPYYMYGPRKLEIVSIDPHIVVIHDFIMDSECDGIVKEGSPQLKRSAMVGNQNNGTMDDRRVSEQTWLTESDVEGLAKLTKRIDYFLDLESESMSHSEVYQVANYGLAGLYDCHYDPLMMNKGSMQARISFNHYAGDRMATIMGYLSDVMAGGNTVFPVVGAYVKPRKGSVALWWNMDTLGGYDSRMRHGGCPVLIGSKWITNKWIRANSQMFKRPCPKYTGRQLRQFRSSKDQLRKGDLIRDP